MEDIRAFLLLPLFYLTMTSGLPPGPRLMDMSSNSSIIMDVVGGNFSAPSTTTAATVVGSMIMDETTKATESSAGVQSLANKSTSTTSSSSIIITPTTTNTIEAAEKISDGSLQDSHDLKQHITTPDTPIHSPLVQTNITKVPLRSKCNISSQCFGDHTECKNNYCKCSPGYLPRSDNGMLCGEASLHHVQIPQADPTMIGVVVGLALMSVTLCVVLRLFAKARFRENRTIFNTPNPRLMNVSLLKGGSNKLVRGNSAPRSRRGSTASGRSGAEPGTPTSPDHPHPHPHPHPHSHSHEPGSNAVPMVASSRVKPPRQMSTDAAGAAKQKIRHQDSVASNV